MSRVNTQCTSPSTILPKLSEIVHVLEPLHDKYHELGIQLDISSNVLKRIEGDYSKTLRRFTEMIEHWQNTTTNCSWSALADAVTRVGGHDNLVDHIKGIGSEAARHHCNITVDGLSVLPGNTMTLNCKTVDTEAEDTGYSSKGDSACGDHSESEVEHFDEIPGCQCDNPCSLYTVSAGECANPLNKKVGVVRKRVRGQQREVQVQSEEEAVEEDHADDFEKETRQLRTHYAGFVNDISRSFKKRNVTTDEVILYLQNDSPLALKPRITEMMKATSLEQIFTIVTEQACSWFDYQLIKDLIIYFNDPHDKECLQKYEAHFERFARQRLPKGTKHIEVGSGARRGGKQLVIKIDKEWETVTFNDLDRLRGAFASIFGIRRRDLYLADIRQGCIMMTFMITSELAERFPGRNSLTSLQVKSLNHEGVVLLRCGKSVWRSSSYHNAYVPPVGQDRRLHSCVGMLLLLILAINAIFCGFLISLDRVPEANIDPTGQCWKCGYYPLVTRKWRSHLEFNLYAWLDNHGNSSESVQYLCTRGDIALASNDNNGATVTFVNTRSGRTSDVAIPDGYIPTSDICGQYFDRCKTVSLTSENRTVVALPLNDSVGLALHSSENGNGTDNDSLQWHTISPEECTFIYFVPIQDNEVVGYCIKLGTLYTFDITVGYTSLDSSSIRPRIVGNMYPLGISANRTHFVHFDNDPGDNCFSTEGPYVFFLVNNVLIEHSFSDGFATVGTIGTPATCTRLQRIGECELAAYCRREVFTFSIHDQDRVNIAPTLVPLTNDGGLVLLCSSNYLVYLRNNSLTLYNRNTLSPLDNPIYTQLDEEDIIRGECQGSETDSTAFVVTLQGTNSSLLLYRITLMQQDSSTTTANFTDITPTDAIDSGNMGSDAVVAETRSQYAIVSNGTSTLIFNWMLPCNVRPLFIQSAFMLVNFITNGVAYQCGCSSPVMTTIPTSESPTTTSSTTTSPTTSRPATGSSPSTPFDPGNLHRLIIGSYVLTCSIFLFLVVVLIIIIIIIIKKGVRCSNTTRSYDISSQLAPLSPVCHSEDQGHKTKEKADSVDL